MRAIQNWLDRFCYRHPRIGIPGLMRFIIIGNVIVYLLNQFSFNHIAGTYLLGFDASSILHGQIWRIITFIFVPQQSGNIFFFAITMYFYYFIGSALEQEWGAGKFTVFYGTGVLLNILLGFWIGSANMYFVNMSMFFAFATLYPDLQFLLFFIIPVKAKWLAWVDAAFFVLHIGRFLFAGLWPFALVPVVAILNYFLFFSADLGDQLGYWKRRVSRNRNKTVNFQTAQQHVREKKGYLHKCAVCGRTDVSHPNLEFRYCSKCNGYYCYCSDHINSHVHVE